MPNFTQEAIKKTFLSLLDEHPLSQITVKMIVEECGINRNSFYYHFQDLPALIEEIVREEADRIIAEYPAIESVETAMTAVIDFASKNRRAILHIYRSVNRDIFERYLWEVCNYVVSAYGKKLSENTKINDFDKDVILRFYKCECFGFAIEWLDEGVSSDIRKRLERLCELHHGLADEMVRRAMESGSE